jgi:hypothetical protein
MAHSDAHGAAQQARAALGSAPSARARTHAALRSSYSNLAAAPLAVPFRCKEEHLGAYSAPGAQSSHLHAAAWSSAARWASAGRPGRAGGARAQEAAASDSYDSGEPGGVADDRKLVVLGLPWVTDEASLRKYFAQFGPLQVRGAAISHALARCPARSAQQRTERASAPAAACTPSAGSLVAIARERERARRARRSAW